MSPFRRALKYPLRYKRYLIVVVWCVLVGGLCYGGGIGTIFPVIKLITSPEGPGGAADIGLSEKMMGVSLWSVEFKADTKVEIDKVEEKSPAEQVGLKPGDTIQQVNGQQAYLQSFTRLVAQKNPSETIEIVWKNKKGLTQQGTIRLAKARFDVRFLARLAGLLPRGDENRLRSLGYILLGFWLINVLQSAIKFLQDFCAGIMIECGLTDLRTKVYRKALYLPLNFYSAQGGASNVSSRFMRDAPIIMRGMDLLLTQTILEPFKFLVAMSLALYCSWKLTIIVLAVAPVVLLLINRFGRIMKKATTRSLQVWGKILGQLNETLGNIRVIKAYSSEAYERRRFFRANRGLLKHLIRIARVEALTSPTIALMGITMATVGIFFACKQVLSPEESMKTETLFLFFGAIFGMAESLRKLSSVPNKLQAANAAAERMFAIMDHPTEHQDRQAPELGALSREIEFRNIEFTYPGAVSPALKNVKLVIPKGHTVALVGPNGSGKTTLVSLLPRFFDPDAGCVLFDSQDIRKVNLRSLRRQMAMVTQQTVIFADTVRSNIAYGLVNTAQEKIIEAAKKAYAHEFIELLPDGYDTVLTESGQNLSGGQRQRLNIARAILRDPQILILDEATSNIDADSEAKISQVLREFTRGRTCFIVAHRFATVMAAETIVVMDEGRIIAAGSHEKLMQTCPLYHGLYETQLQHE